MLQTALVFLFNSQNQILLWMKKRGFGVGKRNAPGRKLKSEETVVQGALRELEEEIWVKLNEEDLQYKGILHFLFPDGPGKSWNCSVFFAHHDGEVTESEELAPKRFNIEDIPYAKMWEDDKIWLAELLKGAENVEYTFTFDTQEVMRDWKRIN